MKAPRRFAFRFVSLFRSSRAETELSREIQAHLRLLEDEFAAKGMSAADARYAAKRAFGGVEQAKEHHRDARSFRWLAGWPMDLKLGVRMFVKYPGLTIVAVIALSVSIGAGAAFMEFVTDMVHPTLPYKDGGRIAGIVNWDPAARQADRRAMHHFLQWRDQLTTVVDLGATYSLQRNLITDDGRSETVKAAEISASAFRVIPTPPLLGRALTDDDERPSSPPVAVIGEAVWQSRFDGDPAILGRTIRVGRSTYTVVGVMPRSFGFPLNHSLWVPLRAAAADYPRGAGPQIIVFGRLAPGAGYERAQAELTAIGERLSDAAPKDAAKLRPLIKPYVTAMWTGFEDGEMQRMVLYGANLLFLGLLGICGANVATLVFARTVTREGEITVRTALGASRGRIVSQLFAEALVLSSVAAVVGLAIASAGGRWAKVKFVEAQNSAAPFWLTDALAPETFLYAALLAVLAAAVVGIVPALKATGPRLQARLKSAGAAGAGMKFGGVWTGVIVTQVAITVIFLTTVVTVGLHAYRSPLAHGTYTFPSAQYLTLRLEMDDETSARMGVAAEAEFRARYKAAFRDLERRLELDPAIAAVTHTTSLPSKGWEFVVDMDPSVPLPPRGGDDPLWVRSTFVAADFFAAFDAPIVSGRGFSAADAEQARPVAVVDETFVRTVLGGRDPVGIRLRQKRAPEQPAAPWLEVVGVVRDLASKPGKTTEDAMLYRPAAPAGSLSVVIRARAAASALPSAVGRIAAEADPTLRLYEVMPLDDVRKADGLAYGFFSRVLAIVSAVAVLLSTAGVYSLMSFTLSRRTREIGIRVALGAAPRRIVAAIFSRAFAQIGLGIMAGSVPGYLLVARGAPELTRGAGTSTGLVATVAIATFIAGVTVLACLLPARRALRIPPTEALRAE
jgi:putative ABC transport system permease protein